MDIRMPISQVSEIAKHQDAEMIMLYSGGATLQEIGDAVGLTRERVRQRIRRAGYEGWRNNGWKVDPVAVCRAAETAESLEEVAKVAGTSCRSVEKVLGALGKLAEFTERNRLLRRQQTRERLLVDMQRLAKKLGRTPNRRDLDGQNGRPWFTSYFAHFGSLRNAQTAAGLVPNDVGGCGGKRLLEEEVNTIQALYRGGESVTAIERITGRSRMAVTRVLRKAGLWD